MVRKGWTKMDVPDGWVQIIRRIARIESQLFRIVLLRRLNLPLPLSAGVAFHSIPAPPCNLRKGWDFGKEGVQNVTARICREAGGRVTTNVMVRDLDLAGPHVADTRRLEIVVDGLPLFGGGPVGHRHHDCEHTPCQRRSAKCPCGRGSFVRSSTTEGKDLPRTHWSSRARSGSKRGDFGGSLISCTVARVVAMSLLGLPGVRGADGQCPPFHDVEWDFRHASLDP